MSVALAVPVADRTIPWNSPARFMEIGREGHLNGSLRDCVAAYRALSPDRRNMAMIMCDALVPTCRGLPAVRGLEPRDMDCLVEAIQAEEGDHGVGGPDKDESAPSEPASLPL